MVKLPFRSPYETAVRCAPPLPPRVPDDGDSQKRYCNSGKNKSRRLAERAPSRTGCRARRTAAPAHTCVSCSCTALCLLDEESICKENIHFDDVDCLPGR
ncbi:hypothetical protein EVAR_39219_1 [Eumeta japonica]|uniref:Uncharacterized protein n=1 Tax=Eumeta variegata TaxID=151549 RepID=A0A4C1VMU9_EUMVA|nr:hypothetical protein EVAR_39219_1 [Eumeta japonica]